MAKWLCNNQAMEQWGLRRWPSPFDWIFSAPEMVKHCLNESTSFNSFLDQTKYIPAPCNKARFLSSRLTIFIIFLFTWRVTLRVPPTVQAGHEIYSEMLHREVIFNHHNPMLEKDYDFFVSSVKSLQALMESRESMPTKSNVLFLLFNLEGRVQLKDVALRELFQELSSQCAWSFQLLVVKVHTKTEDRPWHRLIENQHSNRRNLNQQLLVYELFAQGTHDGWRFSDEQDMKILGEIVLTGRDFRLYPSPIEPLMKCNTLDCPFSTTWLSTHCCHTCGKTRGSRHGDKCDRYKHADIDTNVGQSAETKHGTVLAPRQQRFQACLAKAQEMQCSRSKSLQLQTSALRKLQRNPFLSDWMKAIAVNGNISDSNERPEWRFLGFPIAQTDLWRLWCPGSTNLLPAFETLMDPRISEPIDEVTSQTKK